MSCNPLVFLESLPTSLKTQLYPLLFPMPPCWEEFGPSLPRLQLAIDALRHSRVQWLRVKSPGSSPDFPMCSPYDHGEILLEPMPLASCPFSFVFAQQL